MNGMKSDETYGRRITDLVDSLHGSGPHRCTAVLLAAMHVYKQALARRIEDRGGPLDADDLEAVFEQCSDPSSGLSLLATKSYAACTEATREAIHDGQRVDPFGRLIIETFSHRLANKGEHKDGTIDRAHLPGLFKVLRVMLGEETLGMRTRVCQMILNELRFEHANDFTWRLFYDDRRSRDVLMQTVLDFVGHFEDFERRVQWFLDVVNTRPPGADRGDDATRSTDFSAADLMTLARAMIDNVGKDLEAAIALRKDRPGDAFRRIIARFAADETAR